MSEGFALLHKSVPGLRRNIRLFTTGAAPGEFEVAPLTEGKKLRVVALIVTCTSGNAFELKSGASTVLMHGLINATVQTTVVFPYTPVGWVETVAGENLRLNQTTSVAGIWATHAIIAEVD